MGERPQERGSDRIGKHPNQIGKYLVGGIIGKGAFGSVYRALDQDKGLMVAIKQMSSTVLGSGDLGSIEMEINLLSKLKHRNIVKYIDSIRTDQHLNIVLEYIEGGSLAGIVKRFHAIPETLCANYTLQILLGLQYLHSQGVVHRDIKGANVLVTKTGTVKLADFGVATKLSEVDNSKRCVVGTPYWMAPEIVEMSPPTPACDLWSVGGTVVEMITESPPYAHLPQVSALYRIVSDRHPPLPECISPHLETFLLACWEKNPSLRAGAGELLQHEWIRLNKRHLGIGRVRRQPSVTPDREAADDEDEDDEDIEAVETFVATATGSKDVSAVFLAAGASLAGGAAPAPPSPGAAGAAAGAPHVLAPAAGPGSAGGAGASEAGSADVRGGNLFLDVLGAASVAPENKVLPQTPPSVGAALAPALQEPVVEQSAPRSVRLEPIAADAAEAPVLGAGNGASATSVEEYHFHFLDYLQKMDQHAAIGAGAAGSTILRPLSAPAITSVVTALPDTTDAKVTQESASVPPAPATPQAPNLPRRLVSRMGSVSSANQAAGGGEQTPLVPPQLEAGPFGAQSLAAPLGPWSGPAASMAAPAGQRDAAEIKQLLGRIKPFEDPEVLVQVCERLIQLLQQPGNEESNCQLVMQCGAVPIVEMLQVSDPTLLRVVLKMVNQLMDGSQVAQEIFATVGLIPAVLSFARAQDLPHLRREAAHFISRLCNTSPRSLQMLVACGGLEALADLVAHDYYNNRDLVWLALDALVRIFEHADQNRRVNDFCRILAKHGLCGHLCVLIDTLAGDIRERAAQYLRVVVDLVLVFAKEGDAIVKVFMAKAPVLDGFISALEFLPQDLSVQIFKTFKWLAQEPSVLNMLENAGVVPVLVTMLSSLGDAGAQSDDTRESSKDPRSQCLLALFYLCKLSRPRQEQAALAGAVPVLQGLVEQRHVLKVYAFVMLCDMPSASLATRRILWASGGLGLLVRCLEDPELQTFALEALVMWIGVKEHRADWCHRLEDVLLREGSEFVPQLLALFGCPDASVFMKVLEQLLKLARLSERLVAALADRDEFFEVTKIRMQPRSADPQAPTPPPRLALDPGPQAAEPPVVLGSPSAPPAAATALPSGHAASTVLSSASGAPPEHQQAAAESFIPDDDVVRARKNLLRLLLQVCQGQAQWKLAALCERHELASLIKDVYFEEQRCQRVILCQFCLQLRELFRRALSADATTP